MHFFMIGDVHMPADDAQAAARLRSALADMNAADPSAGLVVLGDYSLSGRPEEMETFFSILNENAPQHTFVVLGNHDVRGPDSSDWNRSEGKVSAFWPGARERYLRLSRPYRTGDGLYFCYDGEDCRLIFLNTENGLKDAACLTGRQLTWLREKLAEGAGAGRHLFVFVHQALNDTHWHANLYGGFGEQDAAVKEILRDYPQTVFVCGHIHNGFGVAEAVDRAYGTQVEVPSFSCPENGLERAGAGYLAETSPREIRLRARDFLNGEWMPQYDVRLRVPGLPALYQSACRADQGEWVRRAGDLLNRIYEPYDRDDEDGLPAAALYHEDIRVKINALAEEIEAAASKRNERRFG